MNSVKVCVVVFLMSILMISISKADLPVVDICLNRAGNQTVPDIDGDIVVWVSDENVTTGLDVYWKHFGDPNEPNMLSLSLNQEVPAVSGDILVWMDRRLSSDRDIYAYDIANRIYIPLRTADGINQRGPDVCGNRIVCEHFSGGYYNAAVFNSLNNQYELIAPAASTQFNIAIDGSRMVWMDNRNGSYDIYLCDLSIKPYAPQRLTFTATDDYRPAISGDLVVWEDHTNESDLNLIVYSITAGSVVWTCGDVGEQSYPAISGSLIVWQEKSPGRTDYDIRGYDLGTGAYLGIAGSTKNDQFPAISGRRVVWQRANTNNDIVGAVIPTPASIAVTTPNGGEQILAESSMEISWRMVNGTLPANVKIEFSSNAGTDWQVIEPAVPAGIPYLWDPVADIDSPNCLIRVSDAADSMVSDISNTVFRVFQCSPELTADLTGDCFVDMEDLAAMAAQWLTCGNPYDAGWCTH